MTEQNGFEQLLDTVTHRLEEAETALTSSSREALALAIVQSVASFVLQWNEGTEPESSSRYPTRQSDG